MNKPMDGTIYRLMDDPTNRLMTVEPRSNGPASNGIPALTNANSWSLQLVFFNFLCWQKQISPYNRKKLLVP